MKDMKKLISLWLVLCLVVSMVPVPTFAEETAEETAVTETTMAAAETTLPTEAAEETTAPTEMTEENTVPTETEKETTATEEPTVPETETLTVTDEAVAATTASGTCGDNLTWTFEKETGTLTVSGTGDLANGNRFRDYWDDSNLVDKSEIRSVIIEEGVTSIGDDVFNFCTSLESVTLPEGLLTIGEWAFRHCAMTTIDLPETLTFIGNSAFWYCENLTSIVIPKSVQTIHFSAFADCYSLTSVTLEEGVTYINSFAFEDCTALEEIVIPNSMTKISNSFPGGTALKSVTIPVTVTEIYDGAFENCTALETVNYGGTRAQWNKITIGSDNECLTRCYKGHGFSPQFDGWSFVNNRVEGFGYSSGYHIPEERYETVFGSAYTAVAKSSGNNIYQSMIEPSWSGNCNGMSATSILFYLGMLDRSEYFEKEFETVNSYYTRMDLHTNILGEHIHTISEPNSKITNLIECYQILWNNDTNGYSRIDSTYDLLGNYTDDDFTESGWWLWKNKTVKHDPNGTYIDSVLNRINETVEPLMVYMWGYYESKDKEVAHAVVVRTDKKPEQDPEKEGWYRVYIYDPNVPYMSEELISQYGYEPESYYLNHFDEDHYIELNPTKNLWRYNGDVNGGSSKFYWGCDKNENIEYLKDLSFTTDEGEKVIADYPDQMYVYSISNVGYPTDFNGTEPWLSKWKDKLNIRTTSNSNMIILDKNGNEICEVIKGIPVVSVGGIDFQNHAGITQDGESSSYGTLTIPYTDITIEYMGGDDISIIGNDAVVNIASTGNVSMDISINNGKVSLNSTDSSEIIMQVSDVYSNSEYTSVVADGTLDAGDTVTIQLKNDDFSAEFDGTGSLELTTDHEEAPESRVIGTLNEDNPKKDIDDVREQTPPSVPMHRMYDPNSGEHFYTGSEVERDFLVNAGWHYEGVGFNSPLEGKPVYRLYEPVYGEHLYTMDEAERAKLISWGWNDEGVAFNSAESNEVPQYRLRNPNAKRGGYHFTGSAQERQDLMNVGWVYEGIGWYSCQK